MKNRALRDSLRTKSRRSDFVQDTLVDIICSQPWCVASGCGKEATHSYLRRGYCEKHAREASQKVLPRLNEHVADESKALYVYAIEAPEFALFKIGKSRNPMQRFHTLQTCVPVEIQLRGYVLDLTKGRLEAWLHAYLQRHKKRGEWFHDTADTRHIVNLIVDNRTFELFDKVKQSS